MTIKPLKEILKPEYSMVMLGYWKKEDIFIPLFRNQYFKKCKGIKLLD